MELSLQPLTNDYLDNGGKIQILQGNEPLLEDGDNVWKKEKHGA